MPLLQDPTGLAATEAALVLPTFLVLLIGMMDMGQMAWAKLMLNGAVAAAARNATLETAQVDSLDAEVLAAIRPVIPNVTIATKRTNYYDFSDIARAEKWNDNKTKNGTCDNGETYTDENGNGHWDADVGETGNGSANDAVLYTVTASYTSNFGVPFFPKSWSQRKLTARAVKKNQPYANQATYGTSAGSCP